MTVSLSRRADLFGDRAAVIETSENERYSYADLDSLTERFARKLSGLGVESGDRIALLSRNRIEVLALVFATHRLGCALALISPYRSKSEIASLIETLDSHTVLHEEAQSDRLRKVRETTSFGELGDTDPAEYERVKTGTNDPWLLFHSTDENPTVYTFSPNAVEWNCVSEIATCGLGRPRTTNLTSLFRADGLLVGTLPAFYAGGTVVLHRAFRSDPALAMIERHDVTHVYGTPVEFDRLTEAEGFETANFASVEALYSSAALSPDLHDAYLVQDQPVGRLFGTAAVPHLLTFLPERGDVVEKGDSVGRPVFDCDVRVSEGQLEANGKVVAEGTIEEGFDGWVETGVQATRDDDGDYWIEEA